MKYLTSFILIIGVITAARADDPIVVESPARMVIEVKGIVCSFCAHGARKNLARVDFLDRSVFKKGLLMQTEQGRIIAALKRGKAINLKKVHKAVEKGGYEVLAVHLHLSGMLEAQDGRTLINNLYTQQVFHLVMLSGEPVGAEGFSGKIVTIQGIIPGSALVDSGFGSPLPVFVKAIAEASSDFSM